MEPDFRLQLLPEITRRILSISQPEKIILFGSFARGDYNSDSDLDLLVVMENIKSTRYESNRLRRVLRGILTPVDILVVTPEQIERHRNDIGLIYHSALDEGKLIYERPTAV